MESENYCRNEPRMPWRSPSPCAPGDPPLGWWGAGGGAGGRGVRVRQVIARIPYESTRDEAFARLVAEAQGCRVCPRMEGRRRLLSTANGTLHPRVLFIAEAPGRLGGDRTAVPLSGDQSGRNFDRLLAEAGLDRAEIFITNAVLCNPRDAAGRNAPPSTSEIRACSGFLAATLSLLQPPCVVTLGAVALRALSLIAPHDATLAGNVGQVITWNGRQLVPLYHPGPRAQLHRSFHQQAEDFRRLGVLIPQSPSDTA